MTLWQLRQVFESAIPWWIPLLACLVVTCWTLWEITRKGPR